MSPDTVTGTTVSVSGLMRTPVMGLRSPVTESMACRPIMIGMRPGTRKKRKELIEDEGKSEWEGTGELIWNQ